MAGPGRQLGTYRQATRVLRLLDCLCVPVGRTLGELATRFEVTERQIRRDLAVLQESGRVIEFVIGDDRRTRVQLVRHARSATDGARRDISCQSSVGGCSHDRR